MKTTSKKVLLGATTILAVGAGAQNVNAATTDIGINAEIIAAVEITAEQTMNFGEIAATTAGTLAIDGGGTLTPSTGITSLGGTIQQGEFTLKGDIGRTIDVTAPASVTLNGSVSGTMTVTDFDIDGAGAGATFSVDLAAAEENDFTLGGTLNIGAAQAAGTYTGDVTLTANYQ